jgi:hypothetical protein
MTQSIDGARLTLILNELRLPAIKQGWPAFALRADKESWPAARFLATLAEHEIVKSRATVIPPVKPINALESLKNSRIRWGRVSRPIVTPLGCAIPSL